MTERPKSTREIENAEVPVVFVIDDGESMRRGLTNLFELVGLRVEAFGSAPELLQRKLPDVPGCVVLDVRLPGMSGLDSSLDKASERDIAKIIGSNPPNDCHFPSKPRKFDGGVCCRAAVRTNIVFGAILLVFGGPSGSSKNKINIYAPNADNHVYGHLCDDQRPADHSAGDRSH